MCVCEFCGMYLRSLVSLHLHKSAASEGLIMRRREVVADPWGRASGAVEWLSNVRVFEMAILSEYRESVSLTMLTVRWH